MNNAIHYMSFVPSGILDVWVTFAIFSAVLVSYLITRLSDSAIAWICSCLLFLGLVGQGVAVGLVSDRGHNFERDSMNQAIEAGYNVKILNPTEDSTDNVIVSYKDTTYKCALQEFSQTNKQSTFTRQYVDYTAALMCGDSNKFFVPLKTK